MSAPVESAGGFVLSSGSALTGLQSFRLPAGAPIGTVLTIGNIGRGELIVHATGASQIIKPDDIKTYVNCSGKWISRAPRVGSVFVM